MKKALIWLVLLALAMMIPVAGVAERRSAEVDGFHLLYDDKLGGWSVIEYSGDGRELVIPATAEDIPVVKVSKLAYRELDVTRVVLPEGLRVIDQGTFSNCPRLAEVVFPAGLTEIGHSAFMDCADLTSAVLPEGLERIGDFAFSGCAGLKEVVLPEGLTAIGRQAFDGCVSLTGAEVPSTVTDIAGAFAGCPALMHLTFAGENPRWYVEDGMVISRDGTLVAWLPDNPAKTFTLPEKVTVIGDYACYDCDNLRDATIPDWVTDIGNCAFADCDGLRTAALPDTITDYNRTGGSVFTGCKGLRSAHMPKGIGQINAFYFSGCKSLEEIDWPEAPFRVDDSAFAGTGFATLRQPRELYGIEMTSFAYCEKLRTVYIPEGRESVGYCEFLNCANLRNAYIPATVTALNESCFQGCPKVVFHVEKGSYAEEYARENGIPYKTDYDPKKVYGS